MTHLKIQVKTKHPKVHALLLRTVGKVADIQQSVRIMAHMDLAPFVTYLTLHMIRLTKIVFVNSINLIIYIVPLHFVFLLYINL